MTVFLRDCLQSGLVKNMGEHKILNRPAHSISKVDLVALERQLTTQHNASLAQAVVQEISKSLEIAQFYGDIEECEAAGWRRHDAPVSIYELIQPLRMLRRRRRQAILFALTANMPLKEVVQLRWKEVLLLQRSGQLDDMALAIASKQVRHIRTDLFFWEINPEGRLWPLLDLESSFYDVTGMTWQFW